MTPLVERASVVGVGLIGGSLALAMREGGLAREVVGFGRSQANLDVAKARGLVDRVATSEAEAADADLVVLAAPVQACVRLAERLRPHARAGAVVTDVGSVKGALVDGLERVWGDASHVVGGHPIAGSEESGAGAARADLFRGRRCILTPTPRTGAQALGLVRRLWDAVGAHVEEMPAALHDVILARVSHLPHLVAYALVRALAGRAEEGREVLAYAGSGLLDTTRIAASPAEVWRDIALANGPALRAALAEFRAALAELERFVERDDGAGLEQALAAAAAVRRSLA